MKISLSIYIYTTKASILHDEEVVRRDHKDVLDALLFELVIGFDVLRDLTRACPCERSGDTDLRKWERVSMSGLKQSYGDGDDVERHSSP